VSTLLRDYANESSARQASISEAAWSSARTTFPRPRTSPERHALRVRAARVARAHFVSIGASLEAMAQRWCLVLDYMTGLVETIQDIESHLPRR